MFDHLHFNNPARALNKLSPEERACYDAKAQAHKPYFIWSEALKPLWDFCLVHRSPHVPGKIEYYASVPNLVIGRTTRTSPEMFYARFLQYAPDHIREAWAAETLGHLAPELHFISNTDPDGWEYVYKHGPYSCMRGSPRVRQYAHPANNLALAYLQNENGDITHRTIVDQKKKTYLRIYGNTETNFMMSSALNKAGYKRSSDTLLGNIIYIAKEPCYNCDKLLPVGPYLDGAADGFLYTNSDETEGVMVECGDCLYSDDEPSCPDGCADDEEYDDYYDDDDDPEDI